MQNIPTRSGQLWQFGTRAYFGNFGLLNVAGGKKRRKKRRKNKSLSHKMGQSASPG